MLSSAGSMPLTKAILPFSRLIAAVAWGIKKVICEAQQHQWGHASKLTYHPGVDRTLTFLRQRFWWHYVVTPDISSWPAQNKTLLQPPPGLLQSLPVPHRPWSHISIDVVTGLPHSDGNSVILTVDQGSSFNSPAKTPLSLGDGTHHASTCFLHSWTFFGHCF